MRNLYKNGGSVGNTGSPQTPEKTPKSKKKKKSHGTPLLNGEKEGQNPAPFSKWVVDRRGADRKNGERPDSGLDPSSRPDAVPWEHGDNSADSVLQKTGDDATCRCRCRCGARDRASVKGAGESSGERSSAEGSSRAHKAKMSDRKAAEGDMMEGVDERSGDLTKKEVTVCFFSRLFSFLFFCG